MAPVTAPALLPSPTLAGGAPLYVTGEEQLRVSIFDAAAGVTVALSGRFLAVPTADDPAPRVRDFVSTIIPTTNRVASTRLLPLGEGWLLDWTVSVTAGTPLVGQCFAKVQLLRGREGAVTVLTTLGQGYVSTSQDLSSCGSLFGGFLDSGGALRSITGTTPGAGAEISEVVPTGARWSLLAFEADLTTSAVAANRVPQLTIDDGAAVYARVSVNQSEVASHAWRNSFQQGIPQTFDGTRFIVTTPIGCELMLGSGHRIRTVTAAIDVGDQYAAPQYLVREWIEGN